MYLLGTYGFGVFVYYNMYVHVLITYGCINISKLLDVDSTIGLKVVRLWVYSNISVLGS